MAEMLQILSTVTFPSVDDAMSLGKVGNEFKDLHLDGLAYIDGLGEDLDIGDFDLHSIDGLFGFDDNVFIDMGADGRIIIQADGAGVPFTTPDIDITGTVFFDDDIGLATTKKLYFADVSSYLVDSSGDLDLYLAANKTLELQQVVYEDIRIIPGAISRPGISDPTYVAYDVNGGGVSTYLLEFAKNDIASFTVQLPHSYKQGEDIKVHLHWTPGAQGAAENGNTVGWKVDYSWVNINGAFGTMLTADLSDACSGTDHLHEKTAEITLTGTSKNISSMLICNIKRTDTGADDTWSNASSGSLPMLLEVDFHFSINTMGSRDWLTK